LTDEQIAAALIEHGSNADAAKALHCAVRTIIDRKRSDSFKRIYNAAKLDALHAATARLQAQTLNAVSTVVDIMQSADAAAQIRLNAAQMILQYAVRLTDSVDVLERLQALEDATNHE
jgi:hypothetical protein